MIKEVHTWYQVMREVNKIVRAGKPAYIGLNGFSVVVEDFPGADIDTIIIYATIVSKRELKSDVLDHLAREYLICNNERVYLILAMLALIEQREGN
jgi:hypothetical protein